MSMLLLSALVLGAEAGFLAGEVELVADGFQFTEGPLWLPSGELIFSDIPADTIYRGNKTVFRHPSGQSNGLTLDLEGRLIAAEHKNRRVSRTNADGTVETLADRYDGKRFNSPNDVIVRSDGMVFFTDPPYGLEGGLGGPNDELGFSGVYAVTLAGDVKLLVKDFKRPNGLALSPDEKTLYIADTQAGHIRAFDVAADGALSNDRVLCAIRGPDGMKVDVKGNIWCTGGAGVEVFSPSGETLQSIRFPQAPANCTFGDDDGKTLYVTARTGVYKVRTTAEGIRPAARIRPASRVEAAE